MTLLLTTAPLQSPPLSTCSHQQQVQKGSSPPTQSFSSHDTTNDINHSLPPSLPTGNRRLGLPRVAKTIALQHLPPILSLPSDSREIPFPQLPKVQLRVGISKIVGAGTGLFMLKGPRKDGFARKGDKLGTYSGKVYSDPVDLARLRSPTFHSDYLWEGVNPFTGQLIIIDASHPHSGYGRYMNDGLGKKDPNVTLAFGEDGVLYIIALTEIEPNSELFLSYGPEYWLDPARWLTLSEATRRSILLAYPSCPPSDPRRLASDVLRDTFGIVFTLPPLPSNTTGGNSSPHRLGKKKKHRPCLPSQLPARTSKSPSTIQVSTVVAPPLTFLPHLTPLMVTVAADLFDTDTEPDPVLLDSRIHKDDTVSSSSTPLQPSAISDSPNTGSAMAVGLSSENRSLPTSDGMSLTTVVPSNTDLDPHSSRRISRLMQDCYGQSSDGNEYQNFPTLIRRPPQSKKTITPSRCAPGRGSYSTPSLLPSTC